MRTRRPEARRLQLLRSDGLVGHVRQNLAYGHAALDRLAGDLKKLLFLYVQK